MLYGDILERHGDSIVGGEEKGFDRHDDSYSYTLHASSSGGMPVARRNDGSLASA